MGLRGKAAPKAAAAPAAAAPAASAEPQAPAIFAALGKRLDANPALAAEVGSIIQVHVAEPASSWLVELVGAPRVSAGESAAAALTVSLRDADLVTLAKGEASLQQLYQRGRVRLDGDVGVARRFTLLSGLA